MKVTEAIFAQKGEDYRPRKAQKVDKLTQLQVKSKQKQQLKVGFYDEASDDEVQQLGQVTASKDIGPKIVILEGIFTPEEVAAAREQGATQEQFCDEIGLGISEKVTSELPDTLRSNEKAVHSVRVFPLNSRGIVRMKFHSSA